MSSSNMPTVDGQGELPLTRKPNRVPAPIEMVRSKKTLGAAFTLACDCSGLEDKEICAAMKPPIDAGYFSRMKKGSATLDGDLIAQFCGVVGNTVVPEWIAYQVNSTLVLIKSEAERRAEAAEARAAEAETENRLMRQLLAGRAPA